MNQKAWIRAGAVGGIVLVLAGIGLLAYWDRALRPEALARELLVEGTIAMERGTAGEEETESLNNAINIFSRVIARYPDTKASLDAYYYTGRCYEQLKLYRLAYLKYVYVLKNHTTMERQRREDIKTRLARLMRLQNRTEEATDSLLGMLKYDSSREFRSRVYTELGHTWLKEKDYARARRMFDIAIAENGMNEEAVIGKARSFKGVGQDSPAYDLYDYFLKYYGEISPYSDDVRNAYRQEVFNSGLAQFRKGSHWQAIEFFNRYLNRFPGERNTEIALYLIGQSYTSLGRKERAREYYRRALSNNLYHRDQQARIALGESYFSSGNYERAAREFQRYLTDYPQGTFRDRAEKWKEMSRREIQYRFGGTEAEEAPPAENGTTGARMREPAPTVNEVVDTHNRIEVIERITPVQQKKWEGAVPLDNVAEL